MAQSLLGAAADISTALDRSELLDGIRMPDPRGFGVSDWADLRPVEPPMTTNPSDVSARLAIEPAKLREIALATRGLTFDALTMDEHRDLVGKVADLVLDAQSKLLAEREWRLTRAIDALRELQEAAGAAINALPSDQQDGTVGTFLAAIHRHAVSALVSDEPAQNDESLPKPPIPTEGVEVGP